MRNRGKELLTQETDGEREGGGKREGGTTDLETQRCRNSGSQTLPGPTTPTLPRGPVHVGEGWGCLHP